MSRKQSEEQELRRQSYLRLVRYARPYWLRLSIGILAGILVGGSLLVSLLMIPQLVGVVDPLGERKTSVSAEAQMVQELSVEAPRGICPQKVSEQNRHIFMLVIFGPLGLLYMS